MSVSRWCAASIASSVLILLPVYGFAENRTQKDEAAALSKTVAQDYLWTFTKCNRIEVNSVRTAANNYIPALSNLGETDLHLKLSVKAPNPVLRSVVAVIQAPDGTALFQMALQSDSPISIKEGDVSRMLWVRDLTRAEKQTFHGEGIDRVVYEESGSDAAHLKRTFSMTTQDDADVLPAVSRIVGDSRSIGFTLFQFSSDARYLERMIDTKAVGSIFNSSFVVTRQQVVGECGAESKTTPSASEWAIAIPPAQPVGDSPAEQRKFAVLIPHLQAQPTSTTASTTKAERFAEAHTAIQQD